MSVLMHSSIKMSDAGSPDSVETQQVYYTKRLRAIQANIQHLEDRLEPGGDRFNPHLFEVWQRELVYWRQQEIDATARLMQIAADSKDTEPYPL